MKKFNKDNTSELIRDEWYLVKCPLFSESKYEVAVWEFEKFRSQANGDFINDYVTHFELLKQ